MAHTNSSDGDHATIGRTDDPPAVLATGDENATVVALLKAILIQLQQLNSDKPNA